MQVRLVLWGTGERRCRGEVVGVYFLEVISILSMEVACDLSFTFHTQVASSSLAATMQSGMNVRVMDCGICGAELRDAESNIGGGVPEKTVQLSCKHSFHDLCIRGW